MDRFDLSLKAFFRLTILTQCIVLKSEYALSAVNLMAVESKGFETCLQLIMLKGNKKMCDF